MNNYCPLIKDQLRKRKLPVQARSADITNMNAVLEFFVTLFYVIYYWLEAIVLTFIPAGLRGKSVAGETVLVTGAGSGIGRLLSKRFAELGSRLVLWDINQAGNEETAEQVKAIGATVKTYTVDLSSRDAIYKAAQQVKKDVGEVDILVNNAGIVTGKKFLDCPDHMIQKTFEVNTIAHFWTCKAFLPGMMERNHGHIVNIASSAGLIGVNGLADYCASKFGAVGFDESLRLELSMQGKNGVHTTVVCPYFISTGMFEGAKTRFPAILPILKPEEVVLRIVDAVLCNQHIIMIPRIIYLFALLKGVLPAKCCEVGMTYMGGSKFMDTFRGRNLS
ncbi:epidermal retinol dehydrogenase 2-like isoform X2 [Saccostrea cucullata]|uniref:epidermal retinol dehydrogenase 2-like isoform X2 n=1 Tax=Saccostrea cuccullata TaxID=36930 RepID=UPI002ED130E5